MIRKKTYGINFPFKDSVKGNYIDLTETPEKEIKSNLVHLLTTKKGSRYFMPTFGTNIHRYLFEPLDNETIGKIENDIIDAVEEHLPNIKIDKVIIENKSLDVSDTSDQAQHQIIIKIDYRITSRSFDTRDSVTLIL